MVGMQILMRLSEGESRGILLLALRDSVAYDDNELRGSP